ncbi:MAG: hypothetical protein PHX54_10725, partial [Lentimicrobiaceae bacterium]|nr:hypothetical protein [Lentimicrobiaceae bacterium]
MSGFSTPLKAQDKKSELSKQKAKIEADISYTNKLLDETKKDKRESVNALQLLNKQITKREELIRAITSELNQLNQSINRTNDTILELTKTIKKLKDEYARMIFYAGKNRNSYSRLMFIFSAKDFNQAYQRLKYLQQYTSYRQNQVRIIKESQVILNQKVALLEEQKKEKQSLIDLEKSEQHKLSQARSLQEKAVKNLSQKEKELLKKIRESEKAAKRLQKAIEDLIAEEIRKATAEAKKAGTKPAPENKFGLTPEEARLSANFADNQGRLPWPTERGIIAETFGEHAHPVLRGIKTKNNGIDIATEKGSIARAIFDGQVTSTMTLPNYNNVVIVRHGEFLTVYSNL